MIVRITLLVLSFAFLYSPLQAQRFEGALVAGGNFAQIDGDDLAGYNKFGLHAGVRVTAVLNPKWQVSMDLLYSQRGSARGENEVAFALDNVSLNFVEVPIMVQLVDWKVHFGAGLSYSRLFNHKAINGVGEDVSDSRPFKSNNVGFIADATYYANDHFGIGMRWNIGVLNIEPDPGNSALIEKWISLRFIYRFNKSSYSEEG